jgi:DNA modification methylase
MTPHYEGQGVQLWHGDCLDVLATLPDASVDAVVTDPPYGLEFMGREWDKFGRDTGSGYREKPRITTRPDAVSGYSSTGNQGVNSFQAGRPFQAWCEQWAAECLRVLKPGGHLLAFGGSRTHHRLTSGVEDAGFEIRDTITWHFASGFPKSLDVSKAIDRARDDRADVLRVTAAIRDLRDAAGLTNRDLDAAFGFAGMAGHWTSTLSQPAVPTVEQWTTLRAMLNADEALDAEVWRLNGRKGSPGEAWESRPITQAELRPLVSGTHISFDQRSSKERERRDIPATDAARQWAGWGTALKPATEFIVVARKPLAGTVAANVQAWGTGALNIDACRVQSTPGQRPTMEPWENGPSLCASCAAHAEPNGRPATPGIRASTATRPAEPTSSARAESSPPATSKMGTGCSDGTRAAGTSSSSSTDESGRKPTAPSPTGTSSTTGTTTPSTTGSRTCNSCGAAITSPTTNGSRSSTPTDQGRLPSTNGSTAAASVGRWPSNAIFDETQAAHLDEQSGEASYNPAGTFGKTPDGYVDKEGPVAPKSGVPVFGYGDRGGASRFFFVAKADATERPRVPKSGAGDHRSGGNFAGGIRICNVCANRTKPGGVDPQPWPACGHEDWVWGEPKEQSGHVAHPTVKPIALMRQLVRLVTPPGGTVLEPFAGSGTTVEACLLEGFRCIAIEKTDEYLPLVLARIHRQRDPVQAIKLAGEDLGLFDFGTEETA